MQYLPKNTTEKTKTPVKYGGHEISTRVHPGDYVAFPFTPDM
jgi:hypothetical protein